MAKKYTRGDFAVLIERKEIEVYMCPDCGFEFNAEHSNDNDLNDYECPLCEVDEKNEAIKFAIDYLKASDIKQVQLVVNRLTDALEN